MKIITCLSDIIIRDTVLKRGSILGCSRVTEKCHFKERQYTGQNLLGLVYYKLGADGHIHWQMTIQKGMMS